MIKIKTGEVIKGLDGKPIKDQADKTCTIGESLANMLLAHEAGGKMKLFTLAQEAYKQKGMEVDASDLALIKTVVEGSKIYSNLVTGQILVELESLKA